MINNNVNYCARNNKVQFGAKLPKNGIVPEDYDGWQRLYKLSKETGMLDKFQTVLGKLEDAGDGVLFCAWRHLRSTPAFFTDNSSKILNEDLFMKKYDKYKNQKISFVDYDTNSKRSIITQTYDSLLRRYIEIDDNKSNICDPKALCGRLLENLNEIVSRGTKKNEALFDNGDIFLAKFREK